MRFSIRTLVVLGALAGCGGDQATGSSDPKGAINILEGDGQSATVATALAPYRVVVTNLSGVPQAGIGVTWKLQSGGGSLSTSVSRTDSLGVAEVVSTLGTTVGSQVVTANAKGLHSAAVQFQSAGTAAAPATMAKTTGDNQASSHSTPVGIPLAVRVMDAYGNAAPGATVEWLPRIGGGSVPAPTSLSNAQGSAASGWVLGPAAGVNTVVARLPSGDSVVFRATATAPFAVLAGGNNVAERFTSDLWVADGFGYTGTWGFRGATGNAVKIWQLGAGGAPALVDSIVTPGIGTVSDIQVSPDGQWLVFTSEGSTNHGLHVYQLTSPGTPVFRATKVNSNGLHTGTLAEIGGKLYAFAAQDPPGCALKIFDLSGAAAGTIADASTTPIPDHYCIHDTYVRDGYAFVFAWDEGLYIFDVGNGSHGGSPGNPVQISKTGSATSLKFGGQSHNGWWFHNPVTGEQRYLFLGEEGPGLVGSSSSGDIHVVDVSDLAHPVEVASFSLPDAGTHNFWVDEPNQRLYAAYYNGGVVALDISGVLSGNLSSRLIAQIKPGGSGNTYVWGVMLDGGYLYVSDMLSGFWQLQVP